MAFIPIDAKADVQGSKKGKMTPAQHAQINAWCLSSKTGILDCLGKCLYDETKTSFVPSSDREVVVVFHSGYIAICGRIVECEEGTRVSVTVPVTGEINGKIILRYNLSASGEEEFVVTTTTESLVQEDLNDNSLTGIYELELYSYTATSTKVELTRTQPYVPDIGGKLSQFEASLKDEGKPLHGYDDSKGTIEERLTNLGFKEATTSNVNSTYIKSIEAFTQGKVVAVKITKTADGFIAVPSSEVNTKITVGKIDGLDLSFLPEDGLVLFSVIKTDNIQYSNAVNRYTLLKDGSIEITKIRTKDSASGVGVELSGGLIHIQGPYKTITAYI